MTDPTSGHLVPSVREAAAFRRTLDALNLQRDTKKRARFVHVHATHIVTAMYAGIDFMAMSAEFPEISRYTRVGRTVPALPRYRDL